MASYAILLALALSFNLGNVRMLALTLIVGAGIFAPVPDAQFYLICALGEALIGLLAYRIAADASLIVVRISAVLVLFHVLGDLLNGYPPTSPYHLLVRICEHAELLACIILSRPFTKRLHP